jgi:hypothetical protein
MLPPNKPKLASNWCLSLQWIFSFVSQKKNWQVIHPQVVYEAK